jgi:hypothetical protein
MRILVNQRDEQLGPFTEEQIRAGLQNGTFSPSDLGWVEGTPSWVPLSQIVAATSPGAPPILPVSTRTPAGQGVNAPTAGLATASLVLGILSLLCCTFVTGIPAIICGHMAYSRIKRSAGQMKGTGLAIAGLILGYLSLLLVPVQMAVMVPAFKVAMQEGQQGVAMTNARAIASACRKYAEEHNGTYPESLEELVPEYLPDSKILQAGGFTAGGDEGFEYFLAGKVNPDDSEVLLASRVPNRKGERVVARVSGDVDLEILGKSPR